MEGFKNKILNEGIEINTKEWITQALLRELSKDETLKADFTWDFNSLTWKSQKLLIDLAWEVNISNTSGAVEREAKEYSFSWRKEAYNLVDLVHEGEKLSISQDRLNAVFSEYYGEEASKDISENSEVEEVVEENITFDLDDIDMENLPTGENLGRLMEQIIESSQYASIGEAFKAEFKIMKNIGDYTDRDWNKVKMKAFPLADVEINGDKTLAAEIFVKYLLQEWMLNKI